MFPTVVKVEAEHGRPFEELVSELADAGHSRRSAAEQLGVKEATFCALMRKHYPHVLWPGRNEGRRRKKAYLTVGRRIREARRDTAIKVDYRGEQLTLSEVAERCGLTYMQLMERYRSGIRGEAMFKPVHPTMGRAQKIYYLGLTAYEAELIIDYARDKSVSAAASKFGVPHGAINALLRGEWHRVD